MPIDHSKLSTQQLAELAWPDPGDGGKAKQAYERAYYKPAHPQPAPQQQPDPAPTAAPTAAQLRAKEAAMAGNFRGTAEAAWPDNLNIVTPSEQAQDDVDPDAMTDEEELAGLEDSLSPLLERRAVLKERLQAKAMSDRAGR